jgi:hypothetical protein
MELDFDLRLTLTLFELEDWEKARALAVKSNSVLYCWKTIGISNWLKKGYSIADVLGVVILPKGLPEIIDLPDDLPDET